MHPILFSIGPLTIHTYGVMLALGAALGMLLYTRLARSAGLDPDRAMSLALWLLVSGLIGSRLVFVILEPHQFAAAPWRILAIWEGGLVFYGGLAGALIVGVILMRRWKLPVLTLMDCVAPGLALAQAIGRLGCFSAGCCYGLPFSGGWCAVVFNDPHSLAPRGIALHPAQLYTSAALLVITGLLLLFWKKRRFAGQIFFTYGFLHGLARVIIETFRGDWRGEPLLGLTPTGWFALALAAFSAAALVYLRKRHTGNQGG